ncbi:uncharacterized protein OCT59_015378 [Rhizophagus irregularis]|uniref:Uncharacterized protein n=3 Tax=Rhizophagus irregularis TaxID=588596 RepID=A0A015K229_RHIIW|nr:hypothetical protein RirG_038500 [Rhizophagus irregularis DAOM 197198w]UZO23032.1 hypothetical protein OCT59_015378 [Rhizophagus irregularis]
MIIPTEEIIQQQQNFEQLCERIKYLDIQQQTKVNNIINNNPKLYSTQLPSINEMIDNQSLIIRMGELEERINLQNQEIENLRKEFSELNEKLTLLVQLEVNVQLESKFNYMKQEFDNYKNELNSRFNNNNNNINNINDNDLNNNNNYNYNNRIAFDNTTPHYNNFGNIHKELQNLANELNNDRESFTERMNSLRNMYNNQYNFNF